MTNIPVALICSRLSNDPTPALTLGIGLLLAVAWVWFTGSLRMFRVFEIDREENPPLFYFVVGLAAAGAVLSILVHFFG